MRSPHPDHPRVFISYSHDSLEHLDRVLVLSDRLRVDGIDCNIDQYEESPPEGWPRWMINQIADAKFVLVVCTENYERRFRGKEEEGKGRGVRWEGAIITQEIYEAEAKNTVFIPVLFSPRSAANIPLVLRSSRYYELYAPEGYDLLYRRLTHQPLIMKPELGSRRPRLPRERTLSTLMEAATVASPPTAEKPSSDMEHVPSKEGPEQKPPEFPALVNRLYEPPTPMGQRDLSHQGAPVLSEEQPASLAQPHRDLHRQGMDFWRRGVWVATVLVLLLLAGIGGWYWDAYHREHVEYYANVVKRWGLPEGVGRLTDEQFRRRNSTLMFIKHGRQGVVHEIRQVNSRGVYAPMFAQTGFHRLAAANPLRRVDHRGRSSEILETCRVRFERDASGRILSQSAYNRAGLRLYTLHYDNAEPNFAVYKEGAFLVAVRESGVTHIEFVRPEAGPEAGIEKELRFFGQGRTPRPNHDGAYGYRYAFDHQGLVVEGIPLGADGQPTVTRNGIARWSQTYNALGQIIQEAYFGHDGQPILHDNGISSVEVAYDEYGNVTRIAYFGTQGQLITVEQIGAAPRSFGYDERGNLVEAKFLDPIGQLVSGKLGYAKHPIIWDAQGRALEAFFGSDDKPITMMRAVKHRGVWDERGYPIELSFLDEHDLPMRNDKGCAKLRLTHDKHGNLAEEACIDEAEHLVRSTKGYAKAKNVYDERGKTIEEAFFGPNGRPEYYEERYVKIRLKRNPQGNPVEFVFLDATDPSYARPMTRAGGSPRRPCSIRRANQPATTTDTSNSSMLTTTEDTRSSVPTTMSMTSSSCTPTGMPNSSRSITVEASCWRSPLWIPMGPLSYTRSADTRKGDGPIMRVGRLRALHVLTPRINLCRLSMGTP
jgi:YD repeat-containing protein